MRALMTFTFLFWASLSNAQPLEPRDGWVIFPSDKQFDQLLDDVKSAALANGMAVVTQAGPTRAARNRGITIPNNRVVGVFNNQFAVRILGLSTAAMIEAPVRLYLTEDNLGQTALYYKTPTFVFSAYYAEGGDELAAAAAAQLDAIFLVIAETAR
jgi:uncharacterized protein (DUF302 family)